jgi:hypothetical protein
MIGHLIDEYLGHEEVKHQWLISNTLMEVLLING